MSDDPEVGVVVPGEVVCVRDGGPDELGRYRFILHWVCDYFLGHPDGEYVRRVRGQYFHAAIENHRRRWESRGYTWREMAQCGGDLASILDHVGEVA